MRSWFRKRKSEFHGRVQTTMKCFCSGEQPRIEEEMGYSSESLATRDYSASGYSSKAGDIETKVDKGNIEEAESSLRESGYLNYEEARALLGRLEYQKGNIEAALHVFGGIDMSAVIPKIKVSISRRCEPNRRHSKSDVLPLMSMHAVSLLIEAVLLKAKSLQALGRFPEAAQSCKSILDTVESALPEGLPEDFASDSKLHDTLAKTVELLPELWKLGGYHQEAVVTYRRALLYHWNLDLETTARIQKEFAVYLLYSGWEASPPTLRFQLGDSFVPRNNVEEAILLLLILLRKLFLKRMGWDPSIIEHLGFALTICGELGTLAKQIEELVPGIIEEMEKYQTLALCYYGDGQSVIALSLLRNYLSKKKKSDCRHQLLLASKICGENMSCVDEGINYALRSIAELKGRCWKLVSMAYCFLGILLSSKSRLASSESERTMKQSEALHAFETAERTMTEKHPCIVFHLCLEHAEQRKLDLALEYAKELIKLEAGLDIKAYVLLVRILSAKKQFSDADAILNAALDQTGRWDQGELLYTKARLRIAQNQLKDAVDTYTHLLAILQVQTKSGFGRKFLKNRGNDQRRRFEMEIWHDLANIYTTLSQWREADVCLSKSQAIDPYSASTWHLTGALYQAKGQLQPALQYFQKALDTDPNHVSSLISTACVLRQLGSQTLAVVRSLLTDALRLDRTNFVGWYNLGIVYRAEGGLSVPDAVECFQVAAFLEETAPIEPFR